MKKISAIVIFFVFWGFIGCDNHSNLEQAYVEGYRVGWAHAASHRIAQLGDTHDMHFVGVGKECLYDDPYDVARQLKIFKNGRCPK